MLNMLIILQQYELNSLQMLRNNEEDCIIPGEEKITTERCPEKGQPVPPKWHWIHTKVNVYPLFAESIFHRS